MNKGIIKKAGYFWTGIIAIVFIIASYFFKIGVDSGGNYNTYDTLLGIIIFHNPFVLAIYFLIIIFLIVKGMTGNFHKI